MAVRHPHQRRLTRDPPIIRSSTVRNTARSTRNTGRGGLMLVDTLQLHIGESLGIGEEVIIISGGAFATHPLMNDFLFI